MERREMTKRDNRMSGKKRKRENFRDFQTKGTQSDESFRQQRRQLHRLDDGNEKAAIIYGTSRWITLEKYGNICAYTYNNFLYRSPPPPPPPHLPL